MKHRTTLSAEALLAAAERRLEQREIDAALEGFWSAEVMGADADRCAAGRWTAWMLRGELASAWHECDQIARRGAPDPNRFWRGEDLRGKRVMVRCLHGFGDAIQFLRFAPAIAALSREAVFEVPPQLLDLAPCLRDVARSITWGEKAPVDPPEWDVQAEVMELPYMFRIELRDLPIATGYLHLPQANIGAVAQAMGRWNKPRIGLVWNAGDWNPSRSIPVETFRPVLEADGCELWNLQGGPLRTGLPLPLRRRLRDIPACNDGILSLAAVISQMDLVITVDTLAAHLAGALGVPAWVMLQHAADWRWMMGRVDSPWYPSLLLFRQARQGDWNGVIAQVRGALDRWLFERANSLYRYAS